jgi:hypothetical protein
MQATHEEAIVVARTSDPDVRDSMSELRVSAGRFQAHPDVRLPGPSSGDQRTSSVVYLVVENWDWRERTTWSEPRRVLEMQAWSD